MGIINTIKRKIRRLFVREVDRAVEKEVDRQVDNYVDKKLAENSGDAYTYDRNTRTINVNVNVNGAAIPAMYQAFPKLPANCTGTYQKETDAYYRYGMTYDGVTDEIANAYLQGLRESNFKQATDVRWEYENMYIIFDRKGSYLELVYHIKKQ